MLSAWFVRQIYKCCLLFISWYPAAVLDVFCWNSSCSSRPSMISSIFLVSSPYFSELPLLYCGAFIRARWLAIKMLKWFLSWSECCETLCEPVQLRQLPTIRYRLECILALLCPCICRGNVLCNCTSSRTGAVSIFMIISQSTILYFISHVTCLEALIDC